MTDYRAGTVGVTLGNVNVTGANTLWGTGSGPILPGDEFGVPAGDGTPPTAWYTIASVTADSALTLVDPYRGATVASGSAYRIRTCAKQRDSVVSASTLLVSMFEKFVTLFGDIRLPSRLATLDKTGGSALAALLLKQDGVNQWRMGTLGDDTLKAQRTVDGATWLDVFTINRATGAVSFSVPNVGTFKIEEELTTTGTWTPSIAGSSVAGAHTYSVRVGKYRKQFKRVELYGYVALSAKDAAMAGDVQITGLPFPLVNDATYFPISVPYYNNINLSGHQLRLFGIPGQSRIRLDLNRDNAAGIILPTANISATSSLVFHFNYDTT